MSKIKTESIPFSRLVNNFKQSIYAVPLLQRNYVWDKKRVCLLMDSIYQNYPIGVSLIWKAKSSKIAEMKPNNKTILPASRLNSSTIEFIIDGQQRLTSLYGLVFGINQTKDFNSKIDFQKIYFSLNRKIENKFIFLNNYDVNRKEYVSVYEVINNTSKNLKTRYNLNSASQNLIERLKQQIKSYKFHFIYLETDSLDEVRETFVRINSQGMTVGKADAIFAKTTNIGLRDLIDGTRRALITNLFDSIRPETFIYMLALSKGETRVGKQPLDNFIKKFNSSKQLKSKFQKEWKKYHKAFLQAADYLGESFGIANHSQLPSDNIYTMLSLFFLLNNGRPNTNQKNEIKKWFWITVLAERYSGSAFNKNIPNDIIFFKKLVEKKNSKFTITNKIYPSDLLKKNYKHLNSSAVLGYYLFLKKLNPRYVEVGYEMKLDNIVWIGNKLHRHHIFPTNVLKKKKINSAWNNSLLNICFLAANENQSISDDYPRVYLKHYKSKKHFNAVMNTHLIDVKSDAGVWNHNTRMGYKQFLNVRADIILNRIARIAGVRKSQLFETFDEIQRI